MNNTPSYNGLVPGEKTEIAADSLEALREFVSEHYAAQIEIALEALGPEMANSILPNINEIVIDANTRIGSFSGERLRMIRAIIMQINLANDRMREIAKEADKLIETTPNNEMDGLSIAQTDLINQRTRILLDIERLWAMYESILPPIPRFNREERKYFRL